MTIIPLHKHDRLWSDQGQMMVISWLTMVNDHDQTWSEHDPVTGDLAAVQLRVANFSKVESINAYLRELTQSLQATLANCLKISDSYY